MARDFPNTGSYVSIGDVAAIDITGTALTLACFFRIDTTGQQRLISKWSSQYLLELNALAQLQMALEDGGTYDICTGATSASTGVWYHGAGRKSGTGANAMRVFLNGTSDATITSNLVIANEATSLALGADSGGGTDLDGLLAEVGIWDVGLTDDEIARLAKGVSPLHIRRGNLKGYWPLYGVGSPEPDFSGNDNSGTISGTLAQSRHPFVGEIAFH